MFRTNTVMLEILPINKENVHEHKPIMHTTSRAKSWTNTYKVLHVRHHGINTKHDLQHTIHAQIGIKPGPL